jgi:type II secretory pathway pseudopilin PulG
MGVRFLLLLRGFELSSTFNYKIYKYLGDSLKNKNVIYMILSFFTLIAGYAFLRYAYRVTDSFPFTQEIVLIILGTIATIFITALLLNQQTSVEIQKEQSIRYLDIKITTYQQLLDLIEEMSILEKFSNKDIVRLQFITHKLSVIASPDVIDEYQGFLKVIQNISEDNSFTGDMQKLHESLSNLTIKIRLDILGDNESINYTEAKISEMIRNNSSITIMKKIS